MQSMNLRCNKCGKHVGKLIYIGSVPLNATHISMIRRDGRDPFCMEIVCDECSILARQAHVATDW